MFKEQFDRAISDFSRAIDKSLKFGSTLGLIYAERCEAYIATKQFDKAMNDINIAIELMPMAEHYASRGVLFIAMKQYGCCITENDTNADAANHQ